MALAPFTSRARRAMTPPGRLPNALRRIPWVSSRLCQFGTRMCSPARPTSPGLRTFSPSPMAYFSTALCLGWA
ncbi:hypothetical protein BV511_15705 [Methylorubrum extorquens]|nr:hypothetical protein BV511_15705 [Methylorubrum extorquens]